MGRLTTHVLDTALGKPGMDIALALYRRIGGERVLLKQARTNADGRCDGALLDGSDYQSGVYEIDFAAGDYIKKHHSGQSEPLFLDRITVRFGISAEQDHYHVPLLLSPFAYSTYRGS